MTACNIACERALAPFVTTTKGREAKLPVTVRMEEEVGGVCVWRGGWDERGTLRRDVRRLKAEVK